MFDTTATSIPVITTPAAGVSQFITAAAVADVPLTLQGFTGQTGSLQRWMDDAGTILASIERNGSLIINEFDVNTIPSATNSGIIAGDSGALFGGRSGLAEQSGQFQFMSPNLPLGLEATFAFRGDGVGLTTAVLGITAASDRPVLTVKGAPAQTASLTEWWDDAGGTLVEVQANGTFIIYDTATLLDTAVRLAPSGQAYFKSTTSDVLLNAGSVGGPLIRSDDLVGDRVHVQLTNRTTGPGTQTANFLSVHNGSEGTAAIAYIDNTGNLGSTGVVTILSDASVKENISDVVNAGAILARMQPRTFNRIGMDKTEYGFVAQELQKVFPDAVVEFDGDLLGVQLGQIIPLLVDAIKELTARLEAVEAP